MSLQYAINTVHHQRGDKHLVQTPGAVFDVDDKHVDFLKKAGASRDPTADEVALYTMANAGRKKVDAPVPLAVSSALSGVVSGTSAGLSTSGSTPSKVEDQIG